MNRRPFLAVASLIAVTSAGGFSRAANEPPNPGPAAPSVSSARQVSLQLPRSEAADQAFDRLRTMDLRLGAIGYRLAVGNTALCDRFEPATGLVLRSLDSYPGAARAGASAELGFSSGVAIEGVVPRSPAETAGILANDRLTRIGPIFVDDITASPGTVDRLSVLHDVLADEPVDAPMTVEVLRDGVSRQFTLRPIPQCRTRFEVTAGEAGDAFANGETVRVAAGLLSDYDDDGVAAVAAHEFGHNVLHHAERLAKIGVDFGLLSGFGSNVRYFRQVETQADILSVYLLANAGYDPHVAARFWARFGKRDTLGFLRDRSHPGWKDRSATVEREAELIDKHAERPLRPSLLASRDQPLDGDWQMLLVRHDR